MMRGYYVSKFGYWEPESTITVPRAQLQSSIFGIDKWDGEHEEEPRERFDLSKRIEEMHEQTRRELHLPRREIAVAEDIEPGSALAYITARLRRGEL